MSRLTHHANQSVEKDLQSLTSKTQLLADKADPFKKYHKANSGEKIEKAHQHYQAMQYSLKRILSTDEDAHILIN